MFIAELDEFFAAILASVSAIFERIIAALTLLFY